MEELEYIEVEETGSDVLFIPDLERLVLCILPKLKGWWRKDDVAADPEHRSTSTCTTPQLLSFPSLSLLDIIECPELNSMPLCPRLQSMSLIYVTVKLLQQLLPICDTSTSVMGCDGLASLVIHSCDGLASFPGESLTSLQLLQIRNCINLKRVDLPPIHLNVLEELMLWGCPELALWEEKKRGVDCLPKLRQLTIDEGPSSERLPDCLQRRQELGELKITSR